MTGKLVKHSIINLDYYKRSCPNISFSGSDGNCLQGGDLGSIPGWGRYSRVVSSPPRVVSSLGGEDTTLEKDGNGYPLQYSCLENSMTEEAGELQPMRL